MRIVSNYEFLMLSENQAARLKAIARERYEKHPDGHLEEADVASYIKTLGYTGDKNSVRWLRNLVVLSKNGTISRIKTGTSTWEDHCQEVHVRCANGEIPFDIGQHVMCKESGRYGSVVDYIPDSEEYIVVLDPFQVTTYKKGDLKKVAQWENMPGFGQDDAGEQSGKVTFSQWVAPFLNSNIVVPPNKLMTGQQWLESGEISPESTGTVSDSAAVSEKGTIFQPDGWTGSQYFSVSIQELSPPATASKKVADNTDWKEDRGYSVGFDLRIEDQSGEFPNNINEDQLIALIDRAVKKASELFGSPMAITSYEGPSVEFSHWVENIKDIKEKIEAADSTLTDGIVPLLYEDGVSIDAGSFIATKGHWGRPDSVVPYDKWDDAFGV